MTPVNPDQPTTTRPIAGSTHAPRLLRGCARRPLTSWLVEVALGVSVATVASTIVVLVGSLAAGRH